jgi:hypothetical protein
MTLVDVARDHRDRPQLREVPRVAPLLHRERVVRRLLDRDISAATLRTILPGWDALIDRVASGR